MRTLLVTLVVTLGACVAQAQNDAAISCAASLATSQPGGHASFSASHAASHGRVATSRTVGSNRYAEHYTTARGSFVNSDSQVLAEARRVFRPCHGKIQDRTRGAIIYYTTDGWTPTINSPRYKGPITIDSNARIQAIAIAPYALRSWVATARYAVQPSKAPSSA